MLVTVVIIVCAVAGVLGPLARAAPDSYGLRIAATGLLGGGGLAYGGKGLNRWRRRARRAASPTAASQDERSPD
ncbi:hypothetical protein [Amycolatopsis sp. NPDC004625]|uniref:hypothetical protein n=1 Tax=Amycolatopsis sp. NPDC004625 TaxID=3154670 RepID=UPI0033B67FE8